MKNTLLGVMLITGILASGCNESTPLYPITSDASPVTSPVEKRGDGVIDLKGDVSHRYDDFEDGWYSLNGLLLYSIKPSANGKQDAVNVDLVLEADFTPLYSKEPASSVLESSSDLVSALGKDVVYLEKRFYFNGVAGSQSFNLVLAVSESVVSVKEMWIAPATWGDGSR